MAQYSCSCSHFLRLAASRWRSLPPQHTAAHLGCSRSLAAYLLVFQFSTCLAQLAISRRGGGPVGRACQKQHKIKRERKNFARMPKCKINIINTRVADLTVFVYLICTIHKTQNRFRFVDRFVCSLAASFARVAHRSGSLSLAACACFCVCVYAVHIGMI